MTQPRQGTSPLRAALGALVAGVAGAVVLGGVVLYAIGGTSQGRPDWGALGYAFVALLVGGGLGAAGGVALALRGAPTRPRQVTAVTVLVTAPLLWGLVMWLEPGLFVPAGFVVFPATALLGSWLADRSSGSGRAA